MKERLLPTIGFAVGIFVVLAVTNGSAVAQGDPGGLPENHYKVYEAPAVPPPTVIGPIGLSDQFGSITVSTMLMEKFGIPAEKHHLDAGGDANGEVWPIFDPFLHHTWWKFDLPYPDVRRADVLDQFGGYSWRVRHPEYLLAPADKNQALGAIPNGNHYLCYLADDAPTIGLEVALVDQVDSVVVAVLEGRYLCNPVEKEIEGIITPIVDPNVHLTCYEVINPVPYSVTELVNDQFGERTIILEQNTLLCLPAEKDNVVPVEARSWGRIKSLYR